VNNHPQVGRVLPADQPDSRSRPPGQKAPEKSVASHRGMVTVEIAFASLGAAAALAVLAWVLTLVMLLARCGDLATAVARQEARGDHAAVTKILQAKPDGATVQIRQRAEQITVTVKLAARPWAEWLPSVPLTSSATVIREPS
jgi:hypothetical protein